jgi:hypothetical protein
MRQQNCRIKHKKKMTSKEQVGTQARNKQGTSKETAEKQSKEEGKKLKHTSSNNKYLTKQTSRATKAE